MTRWIELLVAASLLLACDRQSPPPPERDLALRAPSGSAVGTRPDAGMPPTRPVPSVIVRQRERRLGLPPRRSPEQRIAFSRRRLAVLGDERLLVWDLKTFKPVAAIPVEKPRAVVTMADGAFVVATGQRTLRLEQHEVRAASLPRLVLLPGSRLWRDRRAPLTLWVPVDGSLYRYRLPEPDDEPPHRLSPLATHPMAAHDGNAFVGLKDGSFLATAGENLLRFFPEGKTTTGKNPVASSEVWRLLPAQRIDRAWIADSDGTLRLIDFNAGFRVVRSLRLGKPAYDIDANDEHFAMVLVERDGDAPRRWVVAVFDARGDLAFERALPPGPRPDSADWVARETRNRGVVLAPHGPYVAVGGPDWLTVWHAGTGEVLLPPEGLQRALCERD